MWRVEALPNTHENFTGGATFVDHSNGRSSPLYRELRPMTGSRTPDFSSGISPLHCHRGISGSWFHSSLVAAPMTVVFVRSKRLVLTTGISPPAKPTTSNRPPSSGPNGSSGALPVSWLCVAASGDYCDFPSEPSGQHGQCRELIGYGGDSSYRWLRLLTFRPLGAEDDV